MKDTVPSRTRPATGSLSLKRGTIFGLRRQLFLLTTLFLAVPLSTALLLRCMTYVRILGQHQHVQQQERARDCDRQLKRHLLIRLQALADAAVVLSEAPRCCDADMLKEVAGQHSEWRSLSVVDADAVVHKSSNPDAIGRRITGVDSARVRRAGGRFVAAPAFFEPDREFVVPLVATVRDDDPTSPILVATLELSDLQQVVDGATRYAMSGQPRQFALLLDANDRMLAAPRFMGRHSARLQPIPETVFEGVFPGVESSSQMHAGSDARSYRVVTPPKRSKNAVLSGESTLRLDRYWAESKLLLFDAARSTAAMKKGFILSTAVLIPVVVLAALMLAYIVVRRLTRQLDPLMKATQRLTEGGKAPVVPVISNDELGLLAESFNRMSRTIAEEERLLRERSVELQASNIQLRELDALKTKLLSTVSHELRTPITAILASAKIIGRFHEERPEAAVKFSGVIVREAERLGRLLDNLLDLAKIESGASPWDDTNVDVGALLDAVAATMEAWGDEMAVLIEHRVDCDVPQLVVDRDRLAQVLTNLVHNAVKYSPEGGRVTVVARRAQNAVLFVVEDEGPGIRQEDLQRVFDKFYRVELGTNNQVFAERQAGGTGLGLAICREIVEHYGGHIWVESEVGKGSRFCFTIPADPEAYASASTGTGSAVGAEIAGAEGAGGTVGNALSRLLSIARSRATRGARVVIADDDPDFRNVLAFLVEREGYTAVMANDGEAALEKIEEIQPDLLILDLVMPRLDGISVLEKLAEKGLRLPVIIVTCLEDERVSRAATGLGACAVISKQDISLPTDGDETGAGLQAAPL